VDCGGVTAAPYLTRSQLSWALGSDSASRETSMRLNLFGTACCSILIVTSTAAAQRRVLKSEPMPVAQPVCSNPLRP
jgi:hypothetical protein